MALRRGRAHETGAGARKRPVARQIVAVLGAVVLVGTLASCKTALVRDSCLARPSVTQVTGQQTTSLRVKSHLLPARPTIDAIGATLALDEVPGKPAIAEYPVVVEGVSGDICFVGASIRQPWDHDTTPWTTWHGPAAMTVKTPSITIVQTELNNVGDGFRFANLSDHWKLRGVKVTRAHDDCVQNDGMYNGLIDDSFFDGCFVFYSARAGKNAAIDGSNNVVTISDSLIRMEVMPFDDDGLPGHGPIWKMATGAQDLSRSPRLAMHNTVIRVDQRPTQGAELSVPSYDHDGNPNTPRVSYLDEDNCSNNTLVWTGPMSGPGSITPAELASYPSSCWTITNDVGVWDQAVADWHASRS